MVEFSHQSRKTHNWPQNRRRKINVSNTIKKHLYQVGSNVDGEFSHTRKVATRKGYLFLGLSVHLTNDFWDCNIEIKVLSNKRQNDKRDFKLDLFIHQGEITENWPSRQVSNEKDKNTQSSRDIADFPILTSIKESKKKNKSNKV